MSLLFCKENDKVLIFHECGVSAPFFVVVRRVRACRFVYENGDEVCPAGWQPKA